MFLILSTTVNIKLTLISNDLHITTIFTLGLLTTQKGFMNEITLKLPIIIRNSIPSSWLGRPSSVPFATLALKVWYSMSCIFVFLYIPLYRPLYHNCLQIQLYKCYTILVYCSNIKIIVFLASEIDHRGIILTRWFVTQIKINNL